MSKRHSAIVIMCLLGATAAQVGQASGPGCSEGSNVGSNGMKLPARLFEPLMRIRRQQPPPPAPPPPPPPQSSQNPLGFLTNLGTQAEQIQSSAKMLSSILSGNSANQAPAASQLQQAFQPQQAQPQPSAMALVSQLGQLADMVRSSQERSAKLVADSQQEVQRSAEQAVQAGQQQVQQSQSGIQSALTEIGQGLSKIAMKNPTLIPDIRSLYSSVSSKLSSASSSGAAGSPSASFPSSGPIVPAKSGEQLLDNLGKVALGQTQ